MDFRGTGQWFVYTMQERTCPYCESNSVRLIVHKEATVSGPAK
ncbi:MAG: hypothetical protein N2248_02670 [candidate division WOR-3 bacterium]|nr:hypothetical protein [candidate division WOR-3 bacterium]